MITNRNDQYSLIALVSIAIFMFTLDYSMVNIALPSIAKSFSISVGTTALLPLIYLLIITGTLLGFGRLADIKGFKKIFSIGMIVFLIGTLISGLSVNYIMLLFARILQSFGESMYSPCCIALLTTLIPKDECGKALGTTATAQGLGLCLGPGIGGFLISKIGWHAIFFINVPIGLLVLYFSLKKIPSIQTTSPKERFDYIGAFLLFITLSLLVFALNFSAKLTWENPFVIASAVFSILFMLLFIIRETTFKNPLVQFSLFKNSQFSVMTITAGLAIASLIGTLFLLPFYLTLVRQIPTTNTGFLLMIPSLMMLILGPISGKLSDKIGSRLPCLWGMSIAIIAFVLLSFLTAQSNYFYIVLSLLLLGISMGLFISPNNKAVMQNAPDTKQGMASGIFKTVINIGSIFGIVLLTFTLTEAILIKVKSTHIAVNLVKHHPDIMIHGFRAAFVLCLFLSIISLLSIILSRAKYMKG